MKYLVFILVLCSFAQAGSINFGVATHHNDVYSCGHKCNENNNLIAIEYNNWVAARFINSYNKETYLAAKKLKVHENIGVLVGLSHGYDQDCLNPFKDSCYGEHNKELNPFVSFLIEKQVNNFKIIWIESLSYRSLLVGVTF